MALKNKNDSRAVGLSPDSADTKAQTGSRHFYTWKVCLCYERKESICFQHHNYLTAQEVFQSFLCAPWLCFNELQLPKPCKTKPNALVIQQREHKWTLVERLCRKKTICGFACLVLMSLQGATEPETFLQPVESEGKGRGRPLILFVLFEIWRFSHAGGSAQHDSAGQVKVFMRV